MTGDISRYVVKTENLLRQRRHVTSRHGRCEIDDAPVRALCVTSLQRHTVTSNNTTADLHVIVMRRSHERRQSNERSEPSVAHKKKTKRK